MPSAEPSSLPSISDRTLRHLVQYSSLITPQFRSQLLAPSVSPGQMRDLLARGPTAAKGATPEVDFFGLSEFPKLLSGELQLSVPVYTVWGACEDVAILEKIRLAAPSVLNVPSDPSVVRPPPPPPVNGVRTTSGYSIPNLTVLDEATTRVLLIGGVRLRLFGLGGAIVSHKLFDNGTGTATIAGGGGTMWTTVLQIGELVDTAQKVSLCAGDLGDARADPSRFHPRSTTPPRPVYFSPMPAPVVRACFRSYASSSRPISLSAPVCTSATVSRTTSSRCSTTPRRSGANWRARGRASTRCGRQSRCRLRALSSEFARRPACSATRWRR